MYKVGSLQSAEHPVLDALAALLEKVEPSQEEFELAEEVVEEEGFTTTGEMFEGIYGTLADELHFPDPFPDLNDDHVVRNHYNYRIELDWFYCIEQNERTCFLWDCSDDEPYWHISSVRPRYDPNHPDQIHRLHTGDLYEVLSRITGTYDDVNNGESRRFQGPVGGGDRWWLDTNTFNTSTTLTLGLWEEDWSKAYVRDGIRDAVDDLRADLVREIQDAVLEALEDALFAGLMEVLPEEMEAVLQSFFDGDIDFAELATIVDSVLVGINVNWIVLELIFSGKSLLEIIQGLGGACPELTLILIAIRVGGPILIDFLEGDFEDAFWALVTLPYGILKFLIELFTDFFDFVLNLMAVADPDDHIQDRTITIGEAQADPLLDANWGDGYFAWLPSTPDECGPNQDNSSLIVGRYVQPRLRFRGDDAHYVAYYNVKRWLVGGWETFGYTTKPYPDESWHQVRTYAVKTARGLGKLKVKVSCLNSELVPMVNVAGGINADSENEFEVQVTEGDVLELHIFNMARETLYGYVTLEEMSGGDYE
jgi:hypothetical protein